jgi:hypothetical protein
MVIVSLLPLLAAALPSPAADEAGSWTCQRRFEAANGELWVKRLLHPDGSLAAESAYWRGRRGGLPTVAAWRIEGDALIPAEFSADIIWARSPARPVVLAIAIDGKIERRPFLRRADLPLFRRHGRLPTQIWYSLDDPAGGAVPSLYRVRRLTVTAIERPGGRIGSATVALPDWGWMDGRLAEARSQLAADAADFQRRCFRQEPATVEPELPGGR